jgi:Mn-dependent DtxR family transcriptional regulator
MHEVRRGEKIGQPKTGPGRVKGNIGWTDGFRTDNVESMTAKRPERTAHVGSPAVEDYLEKIHDLIRAKGQARLGDIAAGLGISQASVTNMVQRLHAEGLVVYERYRDVGLTDRGREIGSGIARRHDLLRRLLSGFGLDEQTVEEDVEGLEHHLSDASLRVISLLVDELEQNPTLRGKLRRKLAIRTDG